MLLRYVSARMYVWMYKSKCYYYTFLVNVIIPCSNLDLLKQYFFHRTASSAVMQLVIHEVQVKLLYTCVLSELLRVTAGSSWNLKGVHWFSCSSCFGYILSRKTVRYFILSPFTVGCQLLDSWIARIFWAVLTGGDFDPYSSFVWFHNAPEKLRSFWSYQILCLPLRNCFMKYPLSSKSGNDM